MCRGHADRMGLSKMGWQTIGMDERGGQPIQQSFTAMGQMEFHRLILNQVQMAFAFVVHSPAFS